MLHTSIQLLSIKRMQPQARNTRVPLNFVAPFDFFPGFWRHTLFVSESKLARHEFSNKRFETKDPGYFEL